jgi:hypothetical protein
MNAGDIEELFSIQAFKKSKKLGFKIKAFYFSILFCVFFYY